ncbi:MAG: S9 family peptidase [Chitinophagales bacterium]
MIYPKVRVEPKVLAKHEHERIDNYYWLKDKENPEVVAYLTAENNYMEHEMKNSEGLQKKLYEEIKGRIQETDMSVPHQKDDYFYYTRREEGEAYPIYCRKKEHLENPEEILININELAKGHSYYNIGGIGVNNSQNILAYSVDLKGNRICKMYFKDLATNEHLTDTLENICQFVWSNDAKILFYSTYDDTLRCYKIFRHKLGTAQSEDVEVFHEKDEKFSVYVGRTSSRKYIKIYVHSSTSTEVWLTDADNPTKPIQLVQERQEKLEYDVEHAGDYLYITNNDNAINFKLVRTPVAQTTKEHWEEVIAHRTDVLIEGIDLFKDYYVVSERKNGLLNIRIKDWQNTVDYYLPFNDPTYVVNTTQNYTFDTTLLRYVYNSLTTPRTVYEFDMQTHHQKLLKQYEVLGGFSPDQYQSERIYAIATDGTKVPISLVYKKGLKRDGASPLWLYSYGSYGISMNPYFSSFRLSLLDRGFVFALAHIRGGEDLGRQWYEDGKFLKKKNTFTDFIACAEHLIAEKYTNKDKLVIQGGSAGGLLMGAVINMRPDLFKVVLAHVPFVDVITTMLDPSIPLTTGEYEEWGNPNDKEYYDYILSYSPYDNVIAQDYPHLLVTTGINDSQVHYWEPAKWVAKLRTTKTDTNKLLLKTNMDAGHQGASDRYKFYKEVAFEFAFALDILGFK